MHKTINLPVEEAFAFDYLAILLVKAAGEDQTTMADNPLVEQTIKVRNTLVKQLGLDLFQKVRSSLEFQDLYNANLKVFQAIENIRNGSEKDALKVDKINMERFYAKQRLQQKFFNRKLRETKTPYYE